MGKAEEYKSRMFRRYGKDWLSNPILAEPYNLLLQEEKLLAQDELTEKIKDLEVLVEESFHADRNAEVRAKFLEGLETLRLKIIKDREEKRQLNEKQYALLEKLEIGIKTWKQALRGTDKLLTILKSATDDAREAYKQYSKQFDELSVKTNELNRLILLQNKKAEAFNTWAKKAQERYNKAVDRLNRARGA